MAVSLQVWQKQKARTLVKEPLTAALKQHDAAAAEMFKVRPFELARVSAYLGANKNTQVAVQKTMALCLPQIHDGTKTWLVGFEKEVKSAYLGARKLQENYNEMLKIFQPKRAEAVTTMEQVLRTSTLSSAKSAKVATENLLKFLNDLMRKWHIASNEVTSGMQAITKAMPAFEKIIEKQSAVAGSGPGGRGGQPLTPEQLKNELADIAVALRQAKSIGGFDPPKSINDPLKAIVF